MVCQCEPSAMVTLSLRSQGCDIARTESSQSPETPHCPGNIIWAVCDPVRDSREWHGGYMFGGSGKKVALLYKP